MKLLYVGAIAALCLSAATAVYAQTPTADKEYHLTVNLKEVDLIGKALAKMPFEEVATLFTKLQTQIQQQNAPKPPLPAPAAPTPPAPQPTPDK